MLIIERDDAIKYYTSLNNKIDGIINELIELKRELYGNIHDGVSELTDEEMMEKYFAFLYDKRIQIREEAMKNSVAGREFNLHDKKKLPKTEIINQTDTTREEPLGYKVHDIPAIDGISHYMQYVTNLMIMENPVRDVDWGILTNGNGFVKPSQDDWFYYKYFHMLQLHYN